VPQFIVTRKEVWDQGVRIEAKDEEEAIAKVANGEGDDVEALFEYSRTLDPDTWNVEEADEKVKK
jgi:hypothetical protein